MRSFRSLQSTNVDATPATASPTADPRSAPPTEPEAHRSPMFARRAGRIQLSVEGLLYLIIGLLAVISRFWDLTSRAMNHDESLHTYYSWVFFDSFHYVHDPLMHGPFLFHFNAFIYFLFGDTDYTSRIGPALFGTLIVLMPALLRSPRLLGRWGALTASALLLVSPSILYYSRFIRHDVYTLFGTLAIVIAALRFMERPQRRWIVIAGLMTGFLFTTKEVSFIVAFIIVTFLVIIATWQIGRAVFGIVAGTGVALAAVVLLLHRFSGTPLPSIPWENPSNENVQQFAIDLFQHPIVLASIGVLGLGVVAALWVTDRMRTAEGSWLDDVFGSTAEHTTAYTLYLALRDRRGMLLAILAGLTVFTVLYTSLFTNIAGLTSATFGALGYWLGQQGVQRGEQPWFYYLLLLPQYEFVAVVTFPFVSGLTIWRITPKIRAHEPVGMRLYMRGFLLYWALVMLVVLSWAGEKMPWLVVHVALPMILLAASYAGEAFELLEKRLRECPRLRYSTLGLAAGIPLISAFWFFLWAWGTAGPWEPQIQVLDSGEEQITNYVRTLQPVIQDHTWILYLPLVALIGLLIYGFTRLPWRITVSVTAVAFLVTMLLAQTHVLYRLTYEEGDVPVDMLMYSQAAPDVAMTMEDLGELSRLTTGGMGLNVWYDNCTAWPFQWYLRTYPNRHYYGTSLSAPPDADVLLIATDCLEDDEEMLAGYTYQQYTMRWFFPENPIYRRFAIAPGLNNENRQNYQTDQEPPYSAVDVLKSVWSSLWSMHQPEQQAQMFRLVAYRELWDQVRSDYDFRVYVRNDLWDLYNTVRYD